MEFDTAARQEAGGLAQPQEDPPHVPNDWQPSCCRGGLWRRHHHLLGGGTIQQPHTSPHFLDHVHSAGVLRLWTLQSWAQQPHLYHQSLRWRKGKGGQSWWALDKAMPGQSVDLFPHFWNRTTLWWNFCREPLWCLYPCRPRAELIFSLNKETKPPPLLKLSSGDIDMEITSSREKWEWSLRRVNMSPTANEEALLKKDRNWFL